MIKRWTIITVVLLLLINPARGMEIQSVCEKTKGEQLADAAELVDIESLQFSKFAQQDLNEATIIASIRGNEKAALQLEKLKADKKSCDDCSDIKATLALDVGLVTGLLFSLVFVLCAAHEKSVCELSQH
jgi:hypothetical protein